MEQRVPDPQPEHEPRHFFDIQTGQHLLGKVALDAHIEAGGHPADVYKLEQVLDPDFPLPNQLYERLDTSDWDREDYLTNVRWIASIMPEPDHPKRKVINEKILHRARHIGISPSFRTGKTSKFSKFFGNFINLYIESEIKRTKRINDFEDLTFGGAVKMVKQIGDRLGHRPSWRELETEYRQGFDIPSPHLLNDRFSEDNKTGYRRIVEAAGWVEPVWGSYQCFVWGQNFMEVHGRVPREEDINSASKEKTGPGRRIVKKYFGSIPNFQETLLKDRSDGFFPPGFLLRIKQLEEKLSSPPSTDVILKQLSDGGWGNGLSKEARNRKMAA